MADISFQITTLQQSTVVMWRLAEGAIKPCRGHCRLTLLDVWALEKPLDRDYCSAE